MQNEREASLLRKFWGECRPTRLRSIPEWSEAELRLPSGPHEGRKYKLDRLPYARLLLNELGKWRRHVITGPTQSGKSLHAFVFIILYYLFEMREDVIVGVPDLGMAGTKWQSDIKPLIERSRYRHLIPTRGPGSQGGNPVEITFGNGRKLQFMAGGGNDKQRAGATAKVMVITETDGLDNVSVSSKEGQDKVSQLEGRVRSHGLDARIFMECTVSTEAAKTWQEYQHGTASRIVCQCPHCEQWVSPEREHFVGWDQASSKVEAGEKAAFSCPDCGILLSEAVRLQMNLNAVLVHRGQEVAPDGTVTGDPPKTDTLGFRWSAFNNLLSPASLIGMEEWQTEQSENAIAADVVMKQQVWCMPAEDISIERVPLSIGIVRGSAAGYEGRCNGREIWAVPDWCQYITAHVDVGQRLLNWSVNAHGPNRIRDVIAYGTTATEQPDVLGPEEAIVRGLHTVRETIEQHCELNLALVDCRYQGVKGKPKNPRRAVYEFVMSAGNNWMAAMGLATWVRQSKTKTVKPSRNGDPWYKSRQGYLNKNIWVVDFDPNHFKHIAHGSYMIQPSGEDGQRIDGSVTLFGSEPKMHTEFATQLNAERYEINHVTGKAEWKRHGANHYFDTDVGNAVSLSVLKSDSTRRRRAKPQPPKSGGFVQGW